MFSNLKKIPKVHNGCSVDVNQTGMWSESILKKYIQNIIITRPEINLYLQRTLFIIDHYCPHVTLKNIQNFEKYKVFIILIPPKLTELLQPLDVCINRSFQESLTTSYDRYIEKAIDDSKFQTKVGNP